MGALFSFSTSKIMYHFKTRAWVHYNYFEIPYGKIHSKPFFVCDSPTLSSPSSSPNNQPNEHCFFMLSAISAKKPICVHDKYTPVATCKRNKPQHENTKAFLCSYVNKSPDGSFVRLCLLILVFFLDNLFPVTILSLKLEVKLTISFNGKSMRRLGWWGYNGANATHTTNSQEGLAILVPLLFLLDRRYF